MQSPLEPLLDVGLAEGPGGKNSQDYAFAQEYQNSPVIPDTDPLHEGLHRQLHHRLMLDWEHQDRKGIQHVEDKQ